MFDFLCIVSWKRKICNLYKMDFLSDFFKFFKWYYKSRTLSLKANPIVCSELGLVFIWNWIPKDKRIFWEFQLIISKQVSIQAGCKNTTKINKTTPLHAALSTPTIPMHSNFNSQNQFFIESSRILIFLSLSIISSLL